MGVPYKKDIKVRFELLDMTSHLSVPVLVEEAQAIATEHRESFGAGYKPMREKDSCWVAVRSHFDFENDVDYGENIIAYTWPEAGRHSFYPRMYHFTDKDGNTVLKGCTIWSVYSFTEKKALSPRELFVEFPDIKRPEGFEVAQPVRIRAKEEQNTITRKVLFSDTDANGHLNNCKYVSWIFDLLPVEYISGCKAKSLDINYNSQIPVNQYMNLHYTLGNDTLSVNGEHEGDSVFTRIVKFEKR